MTTYTLASEQDKTRVIFDCRFRNPVTESMTKRIIEAIPDAGAVELLFAYIIANTREITFEYDPIAPRSEIVLSLEQFWVWCKLNFFLYEPGGSGDEIVGIVTNPETIVECYKRFNTMVFDKLQEHWAMAYKNAQVIFPASEFVRPDEQLTKELLKSPDFLASVPSVLRR